MRNRDEANTNTVATMTTPVVPSSTTVTDDFFDFGGKPAVEVAISEVDKQFANFFADQDTN